MINWDGVSFCINQDGNPATVSSIVGMVNQTPLYELICTECELERLGDPDEGN